MSRLPVGSSARITRGSTESARAIATRCCSPPESCDGRCAARSARPTSASSASPRWRSSDRRKRRSGASFASTFSSAVSVGIRLNCWKTKPNERSRSSARSPSRSSARSRPSKKTCPLDGPVERAEELKQRRLARAARALERDELARLDAQVHVLERVDDERAARERLADAAELVLAHSTVLSASAGRRRAARKRARGAGEQAAERRRAGSRRAGSSHPPARCSETASEVRAGGLLDAEEAAAAGRRAGGQRRPEGADEERRRATPSTTPRTPPSTPVVSDSAATWRTTLPCVQPSAFSVPSSRTRLPTEESASSAASRKAATAATIERARPRLWERFGGVDERAADRAGDLLRARDLGLFVRRLDPLLDGGDGGAVVGADEHDVDEVLLARELLELRERQVDVDALAAERRVDEADDRERRPVQVELRPDLQRVARPRRSRRRAPRGRRCEEAAAR